MNTVSHTAADESAARLTTAGRAYLDQVATQVDDLPPGDREELLSDVIDAVAELGDLDAVDSERLRARLGDPVEFATELRRSAGLPERAAAAAGSDAGALHHLRQLLDAAARPLRFVGREFESAWWLLRGAAVAYLVAVIFGLPQGASLALLVVAVAASFAIGWRARGGAAAERAWLWRGAGAVVAGIVVFAGAGMLLDRPTWDEAGTAYERDHAVDGRPVAAPRAGELLSANGPVTNLYAFDARGDRIEHVRLFDQNGSPLDLGYGPEVDPLRVLARGSSDEPLLNVFPIRYAEAEGGDVVDPDAGWPESPGALQGSTGASARDERATPAPAAERAQQQGSEQGGAR